MVLALLGLALAGCKRRDRAPTVAAVPVDAGPGNACPGPAALALLVAPSGGAVHSDCYTLSVGRYWLAAALTREAARSDAPRLQLLSGGFGPRVTAFDVQPAPTDEIAALLREAPAVQVRLRSSRSDPSLVRIAVRAEHPDGQAREVAVLLQLVAHAPPRLLWSGPGDQVTLEGPCLVQRTVDFDMLFGRRLEMTTHTRARGRDGKPHPACTGGPGTQESLGARGIALPAGRPLGPGADAGPR